MKPETDEPKSKHLENIISVVVIVLCGIFLFWLTVTATCGCLPIGNKGVDVSKRSTEQQTMTISAGGDVKVRQVAGYGGWALLLPLAWYWRKLSVSGEAVGRLVYAIERYGSQRDIKNYVKACGVQTDCVGGQEIDSAENHIRKVIRKINGKEKS